MTRIVPIATLAPEARDALLALNNAHAVETSHLEPADWARLCAQAFAATAVEDASGFLIAFDPEASHDSPNFQWFRARAERFAYVDRIVVDAGARGRGAARALYDDLARRAADAGLGRLVCEVNRVPPNPGSDAFHARLGFVEVGRGHPAPGKTVRYLSREIEGVR